MKLSRTLKGSATNGVARIRLMYFRRLVFSGGTMSDEEDLRSLRRKDISEMIRQDPPEPPQKKWIRESNDDR